MTMRDAINQVKVSLAEDADADLAALRDGGNEPVIAGDDQIARWLNDGFAALALQAYPVPVAATVTYAAGERVKRYAGMAGDGGATPFQVRSGRYGTVSLKPAALPLFELAHPRYRNDPPGAPAWMLDTGDGVQLHPVPSADTQVTLEGLGTPARLGASSPAALPFPDEVVAAGVHYACWQLCLANVDYPGCALRAPVWEARWREGLAQAAARSPFAHAARPAGAG